MLNRPDLPASHPANQLPADVMHLGDNKFAAKLTFDERCQILALRLSNMSIGAIAVTFGVNRRTVTHVHKKTSPRYQNVRKLCEAMGEAAFMTKYITEDLVARVKAAADTPEAQETYIEQDKKPGSTKVGRPNRNANRHSGVTMYKRNRIEVVWVEGLEGYPDGWYTKLLDVSDVNATEPFGDPDSMTHLSSLTALNYGKAYLEENYEAALT